MGYQFVVIGHCATDTMKSLILASFLVLSVMAVTEVHGWYGGYYYGYWPRYYGHYWPKYYKPAGELLAAPSIANIDYGKTEIKYLKKRAAEADPEADPWFYSTGTYHPYTYAYAYGGYPYAYAYGGYPYLAVAKPKEE